MVTLTFLIGTPNASQPGGFNRPDGFKFAEYIAANPAFANRIDLDPDASGADDVASRTGAATFTDNGREQDAFAEYLATKYSETPYQEADTPQSGDTRIQNVTVRDDTVLDSADVIGTDDDDDLNGTAGNETIDGLRGDDVIHAMGGSDIVIGGRGDDVIFAGSGNDNIDGGDDDDFIFGEAGDDIILAGKGDDKAKGGDGNDVFRILDPSRDGEDEFDGGNGIDTLDFSAYRPRDPCVWNSQSQPTGGARLLQVRAPPRAVLLQVGLHRHRHLQRPDQRADADRLAVHARGL
jgi:Ca2+-binding RTX toxin-like protein